MKVFLTIYGWLGIIFFCSFFSDDHWTDPSSNLWTEIYSQKSGEIDFSLNIKSFPNISESEWIELSVTNHAGHPIQITNAFYRLELHAYDAQGELVTEGYLTSKDPSEIFLLEESINPFGIPELPTGKLKESERLSALCTTLLGVPNSVRHEVIGNFEFFLEVKDQNKKQIKARDIPLSFSWWAPRKAEMAMLIEEVQAELHTPKKGQFATTRLLSKLEMPDIEKELEVEDLVNALDIRHSGNDGRPAVAQFLAEHFSENDLVIDYYGKQLKNKDHRVLSDLKVHHSLLQPKLFDALLAWIPSAGGSTKFRLLEILHKHKDQILNESIIISLSAHVKDMYGDLLLANPKDLSKRELVSWAAAVEMWSYTSDTAAITYIKPFLKLHNKILGSELLLDMNSCEIPKPRRVNEFALEAILRIQGNNLFEYYANEGFHPPYADGSSLSHISSIRKKLIQKFKLSE